MNILKLSTHWLVLVALLIGIVAGLLIQRADPQPRIPIEIIEVFGTAQVRDPGGVKGVQQDDKVLQVDGEDVGEDAQGLKGFKGWQEKLAASSPGRALMITFQRADQSSSSYSVSVKVEMSPDSPRARWIAPFDFIANLFMKSHLHKHSMV